MAGVADWLAAELRHLGVEVRLDTWAEAESILAEAPDIVIDATGGLPRTPGVPGREMIVSSWDVLSAPPEAGRSVLIHDEVGGHQAVSLAEFLTRRGCTVEICTPDRLVGRDLGGSSYPVYLGNLARAGVALTPAHALEAVERKGNRLVAHLAHEYGGPKGRREVDIVVAECGTEPIPDLFRALKPHSANLGVTDLAATLAARPQPRSGPGMRLFRVGDAVASRDIHAALLDALMDPETKALLPNAIEKVDDHRVRLNLRQPDIALIANLSDYPAIIMHRSHDGSDDPMKALAIGTGPFELVSYETGTRADGEAHHAGGFDLLERLGQVSVLGLGMGRAPAGGAGLHSGLQIRRPVERDSLFQRRVRCIAGSGDIHRRCAQAIRGHGAAGTDHGGSGRDPSILLEVGLPVVLAKGPGLWRASGLPPVHGQGLVAGLTGNPRPPAPRPGRGAPFHAPNGCRFRNAGLASHV